MKKARGCIKPLGFSEGVNHHEKKQSENSGDISPAGDAHGDCDPVHTDFHQSL